MTRYVAIASAKGGVGKSTIALNLACQLNQLGLETTIVDADLHNPTIGLHLGTPKLDATVHTVLSGQTKPEDAVYLHPASGVRLMPGSINNSPQINANHLRGLRRNLEGISPLIIIDTPSGIDIADAAISNCQEAILITTADMVSVTATLRTIQKCREANVHPRGVIINKTTGEHEMSEENIKSMLGIDIIGVIPQDNAVTEALKIKQPFTYSHPESQASKSLKKCAETMIKNG